MTAEEARGSGGGPIRGYLVARVVHRRDLERTIDTL
jgi:hypothetical protein